MRALGWFAALALIVLSMVMGGNLMDFINPPSIVIVVGGAQGILFFLYGSDSVRILIPSFRNENPEYGLRIAESGSHLYIMAGWLGAGIGLVQMAEAMDDLSNLGPALAVNLLTIFYGYCTHFLVWYPIKVKLNEAVARQSQ